MKLTRRAFAKTLAAPLAFAAADRPNIILCMGDDHGWNETSYNGHPRVKTPILDEMAASGLRFDRFYSAHPNCSPTRGSIMTGRHPNRYGTFAPNWSMRAEEITIAQLLRQAGYATGHFGKWHLGPVKAAAPTCPGKMGFDEWLSHDNFYELNPHFSRNGGPVEQIQGESSEIVVREAVRFIEKAQKAGRPSFTVIWFGSPHAPYRGIEPYLSHYKDLKEPFRSRLAEIEAMDSAIGQLRAALRKMNLRTNTLLWYCGDNGVPRDGLMQMPFRGAKGQVYEGGIRVPGIIEWPARIAKPRTTAVPAVTTDMLPTLCDLTGIALPKRPLDGISLKPLIDGTMKERPAPIYFWEFPHAREQKSNRQPYIPVHLQSGTTPTATPRDGKLTRDFFNFRHGQIEEADYEGPAAVLTNRYKFVRTGGPELYDIPADPKEANNLAPGQPAQIAKFQSDLKAWQKSVLASLTGADY